ncbi:MAG: ABC transporter permease subunit [Clostridia bacterium]|nr:ABC transporter permease subunit [Clostridia bacterium]
MKKRAWEIVKFAGAVLLALAVWYLLSRLPRLRVLLASPVDVARRLIQLPGTAAFWASLWYTGKRIMLGFAAGLVPGVLLAIPAAHSRTVETLLRPYMLTVKSVPVASFVIIVLIFFSSARLSVIISALMVLPIIYTNTLAGIRSADPALEQMARVFELPPMRRLLYVRLPQIRPFFLSGCSVSLGLCWKAGVAAELIGIPRGSVGERLYGAKIYLDTADLFAWTVVIVALSFAFEKAVMGLLTLFFRRWEHVR